MTTPPSYRKTNPADAPIMLLAVQSDTMPRSKLDVDRRKHHLAVAFDASTASPRSVFGAQTYAVRVEVDPDQARRPRHRHRYGQQTRSPPPTAKSRSARCRTTDAEHDDQRRHPAHERASSSVRWSSPRPNGAPIHLGDVADVKDSVENLNTRQLVRRQAARSFSPSSASRTPTPSRWSMRSTRKLPGLAGRSAPVRSSIEGHQRFVDADPRRDLRRRRSR